MKMPSGRTCILFFHTMQHSATHCNTLQHAIRALSHPTLQTHSSGLLPPVGVFAERLLRVCAPKVALNSRWLFFWHLHACLQSFCYAHTDRDQDRDRYRDSETDRCTRVLVRVLTLPLSLPHSYTHTRIHTYTHAHTISAQQFAGDPCHVLHPFITQMHLNKRMHTCKHTCTHANTHAHAHTHAYAHALANACTPLPLPRLLHTNANKPW